MTKSSSRSLISSRNAPEDDLFSVGGGDRAVFINAVTHVHKEQAVKPVVRQYAHP